VISLVIAVNYTVRRRLCNPKVNFPTGFLGEKSRRACATGEVNRRFYRENGGWEQEMSTNMQKVYQMLRKV
jgi:hypothetical protein